MAVGDGILIYSPKTAFPEGDPFKAIAIVGSVTGAEIEPSTAIEGGFRRRAELREIEPLPLGAISDHLPTSKIRFGSFELAGDDADAIWRAVPDG